MEGNILSAFSLIRPEDLFLVSGRGRLTHSTCLLIGLAFYVSRGEHVRTWVSALNRSHMHSFAMTTRQKADQVPLIKVIKTHYVMMKIEKRLMIKWQEEM